MKKLSKVLGILALTIVGLVGIAVMHFTVIDQRVPVDLFGDGKVNIGQWDQGYVNAKGTWVIDGERHGIPLNVSDITCLRDQKLCYIAEASVMEGFGKSLDADGSFVDIKRWDASTIEYQTDALCVSYTYVIDRATQKLIGRRLKKPNSNDDDDLCKSASADLRLSFVKGFDVAQALRRESAPNTISLVAATAFVLLMLAWAWRVIGRRQ